MELSLFRHIWGPLLGVFGIVLVSMTRLVSFEVQMVLIAVLLVHVGSFASIGFANEHAVDEEEEAPMTMWDAILFPVMAGSVLTGLWLAFRYIDKDAVNVVLAVYFALMAGVAGGLVFSRGLAACLNRKGPPRVALRVSIPYVAQATLSWLDLVGFVLGLSLGVAEVMTRVTVPENKEEVTVAWVAEQWNSLALHAVLNNAVAALICVQGVASLSVGRFSTAAMLLVGVFAYDIFMVFGTGMMQDVAKTVKGPILLKFPWPTPEDATPETQARPFAMLGLGDIVLPGAFIALVLRFEAWTAKVWKSAHDLPPKQKDSTKKSTVADKDGSDDSSREFFSVAKPGEVGGHALHLNFPKPIYWTTLVLYGIGLVVTIIVMVYFKHAQPALLYLVPAVLLGSLLSGLIVGKFSSLLNYSEEPKEIEDAEKAIIQSTVSDGSDGEGEGEGEGEGKEDGKEDEAHTPSPTPSPSSTRRRKRTVRE